MHKTFFFKFIQQYDKKKFCLRSGFNGHFPLAFLYDLKRDNEYWVILKKVLSMETQVSEQKNWQRLQKDFAAAKWS